MKTTVLVFHPTLEKAYVHSRMAQAAREVGAEVRDMYSLYPDFRIDVEQEQRVLSEADRIVLQFPMYWYSSPALLKQWEDYTFQHGWAYGHEGKALVGKELLLAISAGAKQEDYQHEGRFRHTFEEILAPFEITAEHVNLRYMQPFVLSGTFGIEPEKLEEELRNYQRVLSQSV